MIKALELRIGNLIFSRHGFGWENAGVVKVKSINSEGINAWSDMGASGVGKFEDIEPITLTPEILEKAGFAEENKYLYKRKYFVIIDWSEDGFLLKEFTLKENLRQKEFKYLHQLQNLYFALTGEELEVNI